MKDTRKIVLPDLTTYLPDFWPFFGEMYGEETTLWINKQFESLIKEFNTYYEDNFRVAEVGNKEQEEIYEKQFKGGCCGFVDVVKDFKGKKYKLGFNYGH